MSTFALADQWYVLDIDTAHRAKTALEKHKNVVLWCACCTNDTKMTIRIQNVEILPYEGIPNKYYIKVKGITKNKEIIEDAIDLAYVHLIVKRKKTENLAQYLQLDVDPCTENFNPRKFAGFNWRKSLDESLHDPMQLRRSRSYLVESPFY